MTTRTAAPPARVVGPPAGLTTRSVPSSAPTRCSSPVSPLPAGSAPPRPSSTTSATSTRSSARSGSRSRVASAYLIAFASASATTKYAAVSTAARRALGSVDRDVDRQRAARGERGDRRLEPAVGEDRRVDAAGEVAELLERLARAAAGLGEQHPRRLRVGPELLLGHADAHAERDETGLRAVVQVALDAAQLGLLDVDRGGAAPLEPLDPVRRAAP